jgi:hypothetical protein
LYNLKNLVLVRASICVVCAVHVAVIAGEFVTVFTSPVSAPNSNLLIPAGEFYSWSVRSCDTAVLHMALKPGDLARLGYRIEMGAEQNANTRLYRVHMPAPMLPSTKLPYDAYTF